MGAMQIFLLVGQFLPTIWQLIQEAEKAFSGIPGVSGAAKKQLVMDTLTATATGAKMDPTHISALQSTVGTVIDAVVNVLNVFGVFGHKTPPAPPAA